MRPFSDAFLEDYLDRVGASALGTVGGFQIEGLGIQLFAAIEGNHFTILGLPLLPLLAFLREHGAVPA
jgi:septum formation protein